MECGSQSRRTHGKAQLGFQPDGSLRLAVPQAGTLSLARAFLGICSPQASPEAASHLNTRGSRLASCDWLSWRLLLGYQLPETGCLCMCEKPHPPPQIHLHSKPDSCTPGIESSHSRDLPQCPFTSGWGKGSQACALAVCLLEPQCPFLVSRAH